MTRSVAAAELLRPILDLYLDSAVALTGCNAEDLQRKSCELDVLVVGKERRPSTTIRMGEIYMDLIFVEEKHAMRPSNPEWAASIAHAKPIRDNSLVITTATSAGSAVYSDSCRKATASRLASCLKSLGRVDDALTQDAQREADFWLLAASYDFGYSMLYSREVVPALSHILGELKAQSKGRARGFEAFSRGAGLELASRARCAARLEGVAVLHDVLRERQEMRAPGDVAWPVARTEVLKAKASELSDSVEHVEGFCFLGQEMVRGLRTLGETIESNETGAGIHRSEVGHLLEGKDRFLGNRLIEDLGLVRNRRAIESALAAVREEVSAMAKNV